MTWNYRVVRNEDGLSVFDVYYNVAGEPIAMHATPTYLFGETVADLSNQLKLMREALEKPILNESEIGSAENKLGKR